MMNKHIFYYLMVGSMALLLGACNDSMNDLLEPKVYFESKEYNFSVEDEMDVICLLYTSPSPRGFKTLVNSFLSGRRII